MIELELVCDTGLKALSNLCSFALYDLSELNGMKISEEGSYFKNNSCQQWIEDPSYEVNFIRVDGELAGFIVTRFLRDESINYLNHFFVVRKYRRKGVGKRAAEMAFDKHEGKWRVSQFDWNTPAILFWRRVIKDYTNNQYQESRRVDNKGPMQEFMRVKHFKGIL